MSEILASLLRGHHFHTPHRQDRLPSLLRLAKRLGAEVETMQCYRLCLGPGEPRTANWCPTCARGEIFGAGHRQALQSLELVLGYNAEVQPVGYIDPWQERLR